MIFREVDWFIFVKEVVVLKSCPLKGHKLYDSDVRKIKIVKKEIAENDIIILVRQ